MSPQAILLDTAQAVKAIRELPHTTEPIVWRTFITYALEDIVECLRDTRAGPKQLKQLVQKIDKGMYRQYFDQHALLAHTVLTAGTKIHEIMVQNKVYDMDGILRYAYYPVNHPQFNDMLLLRERELPAPEEKK